MDTYKLISLDKISSTQDWAHDLIVQKKATNKTVVTALAQSAGRGKYKRVWVSHHGNLYASFIYKNLDRDPRLSYAIGVAVAETLISFGLQPQIKWPNDILIDGKKISGILIEYFQDYVIIGIGINIQTCPTVAEYKTTKLNNFTKASVSEVLSVLIKKIDKWYKSDFTKVKDAWMDLAIGIHEKILYHGKQAEIIGLNQDGALILLCDTRYVLTYGDEINL